MKMTPDMALDLVRLRPMMDKANDPGADGETVASAFAASQVFVRTYHQAFADYFAGRLNGVALSFNRGEVNYSFRDTADAAHAFAMLSMQQVNDAKSKAICVGVVNLLLRDMKYKSSFDSDQSYLAAVLMIAHSMHAFRRTTINQFVAEGQRTQRATFWRYFVIGAVTVGIAYLIFG